jgi:hypothetical protein
VTRVLLKIDDLERGDLPALSVKTGRACANPVAVVLRPEQRPWSPSGPKIAAILPLEPHRARARRWLTRISWALLVVAAAGVVAGITGAGAIGGIVAIAGVLAYVAIFAAGEWRWIGARPAEQAGTVFVTRVHRDFARAVDAQYGR